MSRKITPKIRYLVFSRDGNKCVVCGRSAEDSIKLHVDHKNPVDNGGTDDLYNLQTLCQDCNLGKSNMILKAANTKTIGFPVPPEYVLDQTTQALEYFKKSTNTNKLSLEQLVTVVNHPGTTDGINPLFEPLDRQLILSACLSLENENHICFDNNQITILDKSSHNSE